MGRNMRNNRGAALIEFAIVSLLLITLVFGIIEFGLLMKDYLTVNQAAREGARTASLGYTTAVIKSRILAAAPAVSIPADRIVLKTGTANTGSGGWAALGDQDGHNNATPGNMILVVVPYDHQLVTGTLLSAVFGGQTTLTVHGSMVESRQ